MNPLRGAALAERILDAFPSGSYALSGLLRLLDIVETDSVPTAAVECRIQPRMLINPAFVQAFAATPEKLLMLVMHELHHVLLGHTTLFPRSTPAHNFVFDAVINGIVCRMFPGAEHTAFFSDYYSAERFPECLLRPPPGWPRTPGVAPAMLALPESWRAQAQELHAALYSDTGASYHEVFAVLPKLLAAGGDLVADLDGVPLLGGHATPGTAEGQLEQQSPLMFDIVRELVEQWPQPPDPIRGRSLADVLRASSVTAQRDPSNRTLLRRLIRQVAGERGSGRVRRLGEDAMVTPLPTMARRSLVLRALGAEPLLHPDVLPWRRRISVGARVHVYLDVSGSMNGVLNALYGAVLDCESLVHPTVHLFSTLIANVSIAQLRAGACRSSGGTDIACVAEHMATHRVRRAVLITDGWVGAPGGSHLDTLTRARLAVAYLGTGTNQTDLKDVARHTAVLKTGA